MFSKYKKIFLFPILILFIISVIVSGCSSLFEKGIITSFNIPEVQVGESVIDIEQHKIISKVETGTNLNNLQPNVEVPEGFTVIPGSGETVDFTNPPVIYTVKKGEQVFNEWEVTVTEAQKIINWLTFDHNTNSWSGDPNDITFSKVSEGSGGNDCIKVDFPSSHFENTATTYVTRDIDNNQIKDKNIDRISIKLKVDTQINGLKIRVRQNTGDYDKWTASIGSETTDSDLDHQITNGWQEWILEKEDFPKSSKHVWNNSPNDHPDFSKMDQIQLVIKRYNTPDPDATILYMDDIKVRTFSYE